MFTQRIPTPSNFSFEQLLQLTLTPEAQKVEMQKLLSLKAELAEVAKALEADKAAIVEDAKALQTEKQLAVYEAEKRAAERQKADAEFAHIEDQLASKTQKLYLAALEQTAKEARLAKAIADQKEAEQSAQAHVQDLQKTWEAKIKEADAQLAVLVAREASVKEREDKAEALAALLKGV